MDPSGRRSGGSILPGGHRLWRRRPGVRVEGTSRRPERRLSRFRRERRVRTMPRRAPRVVRRQRRQLLPRCTAGRLVRCVRNIGRSAVRVPRCGVVVDRARIRVTRRPPRPRAALTVERPSLGPYPDRMVCPTCGHENPEGQRFCGDCGSRLDGEAGPAAEVRKTVTIVFNDVTGSTALGERLDPETLRRVMSRYFDVMRGVLERHGGTVEKFIGDAVMAVFGIPQLHEDDALRAVRAAVEMRERLAALNEELERDRGVRLSIRTGVNTGEVVAGDSSGGQKLVTGYAVKVAARLEEAGQAGESTNGSSTRGLVREAVRA